MGKNSIEPTTDAAANPATFVHDVVAEIASRNADNAMEDDRRRQLRCQAEDLEVTRIIVDLVEKSLNSVRSERNGRNFFYINKIRDGQSYFIMEFFFGQNSTAVEDEPFVNFSVYPPDGIIEAYWGRVNEREYKNRICLDGNVGIIRESDLPELARIIVRKALEKKFISLDPLVKEKTQRIIDKARRPAGTRDAESGRPVATEAAPK